ncbi:hypothetical protein [Marinobacterium weihaiense]|uniref:Uncharacterized protein n=1 Tax=Marinobacterium weihaiense TaxID=2851016 RepID=A0ABS6MDI2_9GAMM|nr:hypothetical protein [Marinobacterium weihaiense]MBV0934285.1 hypothetical protein [Marinobacterium weihaiense]
MARQQGPEGPIEARLMSLLASLFFSVPTAVLAWLWLNRELSFWGGFLDSRSLMVCIAVFAVLALLFPTLFPALLGRVWQLMARVWHWW